MKRGNKNMITKNYITQNIRSINNNNNNDNNNNNSAGNNNLFRAEFELMTIYARVAC
jgi:hypothetical protein